MEDKQKPQTFSKEEEELIKKSVRPYRIAKIILPLWPFIVTGIFIITEYNKPESIKWAGLVAGLHFLCSIPINLVIYAILSSKMNRKEREIVKEVRPDIAEPTENEKKRAKINGIFTLIYVSVFFICGFIFSLISEEMVKNGADDLGQFLRTGGVWIAISLIIAICALIHRKMLKKLNFKGWNNQAQQSAQMKEPPIQ